MDVKFINTTSTKLNSLAISNGQLIALSDKPGLSYDLGGVRRSLTLSDNYTSSAGTAASGVGASSYALATAYNEIKNNLSEKVNLYTVRIDTVAQTTASLGRPISRYFSLGREVPVTALFFLTWNHNKDWVTWHVIAGSSATGNSYTRDHIWLGCRNDYYEDLDGTLWIHVLYFNGLNVIDS